MAANVKARSAWDRAAHAYGHYVDYIATKPDKCALSVTDLVYVKNFKGGSSIIAEPAATVSAKLNKYERVLRDAAASPEFSSSLRDLDEGLYARARTRMVAFVGMAQRVDARINGFGVSLSSALLHFYFPTLVPILDRRVVNGANIQGLKVDAQDQVINLLDLYPSLIDYFRARLRATTKLTLRSLDRRLFSQELRRPPFRKQDDD